MFGLFIQNSDYASFLSSYRFIFVFIDLLSPLHQKVMPLFNTGRSCKNTSVLSLDLIAQWAQKTMPIILFCKKTKKKKYHQQVSKINLDHDTHNVNNGHPSENDHSRKDKVGI